MKSNVIEPIAVEGIGTEIQEGDITKREKVYTFRKLGSHDVFLMFKIIGKIGVNEFSACFEKDTMKKMLAEFTGENAAEGATTMVGISVMLEIANVIIGNLPRCETEIYQILSNTSNLSVEEVKDLDAVTFAAMVIDFIKKDEFRDFIKVVSELFKSAN